MSLNEAAIHYTRLDLETAQRDHTALVELRNRLSLDPAAASELDREVTEAAAAVAHHTRKLETLTTPKGK